MTERATYGERYKAHAKATEAKRRMDDAIAALEVAEREWMEACRECDKFEGIEYPSFRDVRGILKPDDSHGEHMRDSKERK